MIRPRQRQRPTISVVNYVPVTLRPSNRVGSPYGIPISPPLSSFGLFTPLSSALGFWSFRFLVAVAVWTGPDKQKHFFALFRRSFAFAWLIAFLCPLNLNLSSLSFWFRSTFTFIFVFVFTHAPFSFSLFFGCHHHHHHHRHHHTSYLYTLDLTSVNAR